MNNVDNHYEVSEIKNQFEKLQKRYKIHLSKVDPYLVYDLLLRQQKNTATIYMYNIEVFTKQGIDTNITKEYVYKEAGMVPAVYDKSTRYVANQKLTLKILKKISDCEDVLEIAGEYSGTLEEKKDLGKSIIGMLKRKFVANVTNSYIRQGFSILRIATTNKKEHSCWCFLYIDEVTLEAKIVHKGRGKFKILSDVIWWAVY